MSTSMHRPLRAAALLLLLSGCDLLRLTGGDRERFDAPALVVDSVVYHPRHDASGHSLRIGYTYTNPTRDSLQVSACFRPDPPVLQKREDGAWVLVYSGTYSACFAPPYVIPPGGIYRDSLRVPLDLPAGSGPRLEVDSLPGTYRLYWYVSRTGSASVHDLPDVLRASAPFRIEE